VGAHACNPSTQRQKKEEQELATSLGHRVEPCLKDRPQDSMTPRPCLGGGLIKEAMVPSVTRGSPGHGRGVLAGDEGAEPPGLLITVSKAQT
jgi:hypothetical protein